MKKALLLLSLITMVGYSVTLDNILHQQNKVDVMKSFEMFKKTSRTTEKAILLREYNTISLGGNYKLDINPTAHSGTFKIGYGNFGYQYAKGINPLVEETHIFSVNKNLNTLFDGLYSNVRNKNKIELLKFQSRVNATKMQIVQKYLDIYYKQEIIKINETSLNTTKQILDATKIKYDLGDISEVEYISIANVYDKLLLLIESDKLELSNLKSELAIMGISFNQDEEFEKINVDFSNFKLKENTKEKEMIELEKQLAESEFREYLVNNLIPQINIGGDFIINKLQPKSPSTSSTLNYTGDFKIGLTYNINIFDAKRDKIIDDFKNREKKYKEQMDKLNSQNIILENKYKNLLLVHKLQQKEIEILNRDNKLNKIKYDLGTISLLEYSDNSQKYLKNYQNVLEKEKSLILFYYNNMFNGE